MNKKSDISTLNSNEKDDITGQVREYLTNKYGYIQYSVIGIIMAGWDHPYDLLNLSTEINGVEENFVVRRYEEDGEYYYTDSFFGFLIRADYEEEIIKYAIKYFREFKVFAGTDRIIYPDSLTGLSGFDDMIAMKNDIEEVVFFIYVNKETMSEEDFRSASENFISEWEKLEYISYPRILYVDETIYQERDRTNYCGHLSEFEYIEYK